MATAHDVASYILHKHGSLSTWKLQKLVYYSQAWHLAWEEKPLFQNPIQAWANGPVAPALYRLHRGKYSVSRWPEGSGARLTRSQKDTINKILDSYGELSGRQLSILTHNELPWKNARKGLDPTEPSARQIKKSDMETYYKWLDANVDAKEVGEIDWAALDRS
jgi:uncharacterized phage-associated protein